MRAKDVLCSLKTERDGVDGSSVYSFNDRIRVAILGGSSFGHPLQQGFATALFLQPNGHNQDTAGEKLMLAVSKDHIQVGMAANLRDIVLTDYEGRR
nr:pullulanase 1, chloroplastic-like isoform X9 [Ziziphus jujuba var. spinosa]